MTKEIPQELLDKYRDVNVPDDWWEYTWELEKADLLEIGFDAEDFRFSGFWCQGDGASFTGRVVDMEKFWAAFCKDTPDAYTILRKSEDLFIGLVRNYHSDVHECTVSDEVEADEWGLDHGEEDELKAALYEVWNQQLYREIKEFGDDFKTFMRDRMRALYRRLEEEYYYLTSDEQVAEWIREFAAEELEAETEEEYA